MESRTIISPPKSFRCKILLDQFFKDHRQKSLIALDKSWTEIGQLEQHIRKLFRLPVDIYLTLDDCLLPSNEQISIIGPNDTVKVNRTATTELAQFTEAFAQACIQSVETTPALPDTADSRHQQSSPDFSQKPPPMKMRRRNVESTSKDVEEIHSKWINDINLFDGLTNPASRRAVAISSSNIASAGVVGNDNEQNVDSVVGERTKRKRKRKHKNKLAVNLDEASPPPVQVKHEQRTEVKAVGHIRFKHNDNDDDDEGDETIEKSVVEEFPLPSTTRVIRAVRSIQTISVENVATAAAVASTSTAAEPTQITDSITDAEIDVPNDGIEKNVVVKLQDFDEKVAVAFNKACERPTNSKEKVETLRLNVDKLNLQPVDGRVKANDTIAFKMFKMSATYAPELSDYIIGIVQDVSEEDMVTMYVLAGFDETKDPVGKFSLENEDDVDDDAAINKQITIPIGSILSGKHVKLD